jgi:ribosomal protein L40E
MCNQRILKQASINHLETDQIDYWYLEEHRPLGEVAGLYDQIEWQESICLHCGATIVRLGNRAPNLCRRCQIDEEKFYQPFRKVTQRFRLKVLR